MAISRQQEKLVGQSLAEICNRYAAVFQDMTRSPDARTDDIRQAVAAERIAEFLCEIGQLADDPEIGQIFAKLNFHGVREDLLDLGKSARSKIYVGPPTGRPIPARRSVPYSIAS